MCMGGGASKKAAQAQAEATAKLAAAQRAKTTNMVSKTQGAVKTNPTAEKRPMYSLRIPLNTQDAVGGLDNTYGLNIPI